eukprot:3900416-Lingulodinium_polyedra.AAC.1
MAHPGEPWSRCSVSIGLGMGSEIEGPPSLQNGPDLCPTNRPGHGPGQQGCPWQWTWECAWLP